MPRAHENRPNCYPAVSTLVLNNTESVEKSSSPTEPASNHSVSTCESNGSKSGHPQDNNSADSHEPSAEVTHCTVHDKAVPDSVELSLQDTASGATTGITTADN